MKLIGLLSWYDEPLEMLERSISDIARCGVTHLAALDGAYAAFPDGRPSSHPDQALMIRRTCAAHGVQLLIGAPSEVWKDGEPQKRSALFDLGYTFEPTPEDWFFVMDADQTVDRPSDVTSWLASRSGDVVDTLLYEHDDLRFDDATRRRFVRNLFRCNPGIYVDPSNHWTYKDAQDRILWGMHSIKADGIAPIVLHNWSRERTPQRADQREAYYNRRAAEQLEHWVPDVCYHCELPWAFQMATGFSLTPLPDGTRELISDRTLYLCDEHAHEQIRKNAARARYLSDGNPEIEHKIAEVMRSTIIRNEEQVAA